MKIIATSLLAATILLGIGSCATGPDAATRDVAARLGTDRPLAPFFRALAQEQARGGRVAVLQIGDSHTANDGFSGHMRERMQARFGDAGRGMLPPGVPYAYYRPARISAAQDGFTLARSGAEPPAPGPFGLAGLRQQAGPGAAMTLSADPGDMAMVTVEALGQPGGGTIDISTGDGHTAAFSTAASRPSALRFTAPTTAATTAFTLTARADGPVDLLSWTAERPGTGLTWSNLGTIGAKVEIVQRWDRGLVAAEATRMHPALIVLAFGTNEGFKDNLDLAAYPDQVRAAIHDLRRAAPEAAILVAGPPGGVRAARSGAGSLCPNTRWAVPINLPRIRALQRRIAAEEGAYFWDWADAMGGDCAMAAWADMVPPLGARDHVHLLKPGYIQTADALFDTLMRGYDHYLQLAGRS